MKLKEKTKEELELMSYDDIAFEILSEKNKKMKIHELFQEICNLLELPESAFENQIADFFEIINLDKRFIMLENGFWDLRSKHSEKVIIDEDDDEMIEEEITEDEKEEKEVEDSIFYDEENEDDDTEDDLKDLVVIDDTDEEANGL